MKTIIANPPFSVSWSADTSFLKDERFKDTGKLAPKSRADYAFVQDMIHHLEKNGIMAVVLPHGVLFRGSSEGIIRRHLIEKENILDAVIGLPPNLFYGTQIPTCILIFKKSRKAEDNILFIDASKDFDKEKNKNNINPLQIDKIVEVFQNRSEIDKYSYCATLEEIRENDFNLNIPRYVDTFEPEPEINIYEVMAEIEELEKKRSKLDDEIKVYLKELNIIKK